MGSAVIGGMLAATCLAIFIIPVTFYVVEKISHKGATGVRHQEAGGGDAGNPEAPAGKEEDRHA